MKSILKFLAHTLLVVFLTLLTQVGGLLWLITLTINHLISKKRKILFSRLLIFTALHLATTLWVLPPLARQIGRVPLPFRANPHLRPESWAFYFFNRNYVRPELKRALEQVAEGMQRQFPGTVVWYLDTNFPLIEGYPLEPHFSHRDGKKADIAIFWKEKSSGKTVQGSPSPIGYGACAAAETGEFDYNKTCHKQGYWYISLDKTLAEPFFNEKNYEFDAARTRELTRLFAENESIGKILIEPHLKTRLDLERYDKLRRQPCKAARHDDHLHVQLDSNVNF